MLSLAMVYWSNIFLFAKTVLLPSWAESLPSPIDAPKCVAFVCLIPALLYTSTLAKAAKNIAAIVLIASIFPVLIYIFKTNSQDIHLLFNVAFQYIWVIGWNCLLPALALLGIRAMWQR
jgi:hypothetical protein